MKDQKNKLNGYSYHYSEEQIREFQKLDCSQRLKWVQDMNKFLHQFMPTESKVHWEKLRCSEK